MFSGKHLFRNYFAIMFYRAHNTSHKLIRFFLNKICRAIESVFYKKCMAIKGHTTWMHSVRR